MEQGRVIRTTLTIGFTAWFSLLASAAWAAQLSLDPAIGSFSPNEQFVVTVVADTTNDTSDAIVVTDAVIHYETEMLELINIAADSLVDSDFYYDFQLPSGQFPIEVIDETGLTGMAQVVVGKPSTEAIAANQTGVVVAKLTFRAKTPPVGHDPDTNVDFAFTAPDTTGESHVIKDDGLGTDVLSSVVGATYTIALDPDSDGDGIPDSSDNCTNEQNADQRDTDGDDYGNLCDTDFNNDYVTNFGDLIYMKSVWLSSDPDADLNGDGSVNFGDLIIMKMKWLQPPGPSGLVP